MGSGRIFVSYSRRDKDAISTVVSQLDALGIEVWLDQELSGGQRWWDSILEQIRNCSCFVFGLSSASVSSRACRAELDYAYRLGRPIIPVVTGAAVPDPLLPPMLAETQRVDPTNPNQLARALLAQPEPPPLPDPLPLPPPVPISYMDELADTIDREHLSVDEQRSVLATLKHRMREEDEREASIELMERLRRHQDINAWVAEEIDAELTRVRPSAPAAAAATTAAPRPPDPVAAPPVQGPPPAPSWPAPTQPWPPPPPPVRYPPPQPVRQPAPPPPRKKSNAGWIFAIVTIVLLVLVGGCVGLALVGGSLDGGLDSLRDGCAQGDMSDCDQLFQDSPIGSDDEFFGSTCGGLSEPLRGGCVATFGDDG